MDRSLICTALLLLACDGQVSSGLDSGMDPTTLLLSGYSRSCDPARSGFYDVTVMLEEDRAIMVTRLSDGVVCDQTLRASNGLDLWEVVENNPGSHRLCSTGWMLALRYDTPAPSTWPRDLYSRAERGLLDRVEEVEREGFVYGVGVSRNLLGGESVPSDLPHEERGRPSPARAWTPGFGAEAAYYLLAIDR